MKVLTKFHRAAGGDGPKCRATAWMQGWQNVGILGDITPTTSPHAQQCRAETRTEYTHTHIVRSATRRRHARRRTATPFGQWPLDCDFFPGWESQSVIWRFSTRHPPAHPPHYWVPNGIDGTKWVPNAAVRPYLPLTHPHEKWGLKPSGSSTRENLRQRACPRIETY